MGKYSNAHYIKQKDVRVLLAFVMLQHQTQKRLRRRCSPQPLLIEKYLATNSSIISVLPCRRGELRRWNKIMLLCVINPSVPVSYRLKLVSFIILSWFWNNKLPFIYFRSFQSASSPSLVAVRDAPDQDSLLLSDFWIQPSKLHKALFTKTIHKF